MSFSSETETGRIVLEGFEREDADRLESELANLGVRSEIVVRRDRSLPGSISLIDSFGPVASIRDDRRKTEVEAFNRRMVGTSGWVDE